MKKLPLILNMLFAIAQLCHAQAYKNEKLIYLDANGKKTREKNAVVLEQQIKFDDTVYQFNFYQIDGPMFRSFRANAPDGAVLTGIYRSYDSSGRMDTTGNYDAGKRDGEWDIYSKGWLAGKLLYDHGNLLWVKNTQQLRREHDSTVAADRKKNTIDGRTFTQVETESAFQGGDKAWLDYLQKNMNYPDKALKKRIQGQVVVAFVVDKDGQIPIGRAYVDHSIEYSLDQEALRIVFTSPHWVPATLNGTIVNRYKKQPIAFRAQ